MAMPDTGEDILCIFMVMSDENLGMRLTAMVQMLTRSIHEDGEYTVEFYYADSSGNDYVITPKWLEPFEKVTSGGTDTLEWNGDITGLYNVQGMLYNISEADITYDDIANGMTIEITTPDGVETMDIIADGVTAFGSNLYAIGSDELGSILFIATESNISLQGITLANKGIYVPDMGSEGYISKITIPGYSGFGADSTYKLKKEYLPDDIEAGPKFVLDGTTLHITL